MSVTIEQIAKRAGVSASTAARALRGDFKGAQERSIEKAREILRISEELGYRPNWRARALSRGKTRSIGLLYTNPMWIFEDPMNEIAVSFTETLQSLKYDLRLIPVTKDEHWKELVYGGAVDGVAFMVSVPEEAGELLENQKVPVVLIGDKRAGTPSIVPDDEAGGYLAARHLIGLGHKKIVYYVHSDIRDHFSVNDRQAGYERAMREADLGDQIELWHCDTDVAMDRILSSDPPTALIGYCHVEALRIVHAAWAHGISIPTDLSLIAFNDMAMTQLMSPPLTVIGFDTAEMGRIGATMLYRLIEARDNGPSQHQVMRERLIVRSTTAPPQERS
ncbi:MAG: hypothetical protein CMJ58_10280 [Planctomycetaceae bacterium]|nr:hypothetical protein [Planctomycetaceae bacterium]